MIVHVIDPDPEARALLKGFLEKRGVRVTESVSVEAGGVPFGGDTPSAVVTALDGSVSRTVGRIRRRIPGARVMLWSAVDDPSMRREARRLGCSFAHKSAPVGEVAFHLARLAVDHGTGDTISALATVDPDGAGRMAVRAG